MHDTPPAEEATLGELSQRAFHAYRSLVETPGFIQYFLEATPINEIAKLQYRQPPGLAQAA